MMTPTLTAGASARADEIMLGAARNTAVPESMVRRLIFARPVEIFVDIPSSPILFS
jgi:hypothetical protein